MATMTPELGSAINAQMLREWHNKLQYLAHAAFFESAGFHKLYEYFKKQADEEDLHATKFMELLLDSNVDVKFGPIVPPDACKSAEDCATGALVLELGTNTEINRLCKEAQAEGNYVVFSALLWWANEQVEEVNRAQMFKDALAECEGNLHFMQEWVS